MNISLEYFLAVAEEESISRAAERVMVSQQDMSNHIRRLEKQYGLLLERRPRFALTPAGEAVLATYRQVRLLEESREDRLRDLREDTEGTIRLGMHIARARILVPPAAARFCREFPHVRLEVVHGDTAVLEDKLGQGTLHLFRGVDPEERPHFCFTPVGSETVYLVIAGALLDRCFPRGGAGDTIDETQQKFYEESGFDILNDQGDVVAYGRGKTVSYGDYVGLKAKKEELEKENAGLKEQLEKMRTAVAEKTAGKTGRPAKEGE